MPFRLSRVSVSAVGLLVLVWAGPVAVLAQPAAVDLHTPEGQYRYAEGLFFRKFYDSAEKEFRAFGERFGEHALAPDAAYRLILCLRQQKKSEEMVAAMDRFQAAWPTHEACAKLSLWKGELLYGKGDHAGAEACFRRLLDNPDTVVSEAAAYFVARCLELQGKAEEALTTYGRIADGAFDGLHEYRPYALYALAIADQRRGSNEAAAARFQRLADGEHVPPALREEALYRLGESRSAVAAYDEAIRHYERLLAEFPEGPFGTEARKRLCWACYLKGDYRGAVAGASEWRKRQGQAEDPEVDFLQAASLVGLESYEDALPLLKRVTEAGTALPDTVRMARYQEVVAVANLKRHQEAVTKADAFAADHPKAPELPLVQYIAGLACVQLKEPEKATAYLRRAEETVVDDARCREDAGRLLADCLVKLARPAEAAAVFRRLASRKDSPQAAYYQFKAGECERKAGNTEVAIRDFETLVSSFPQAVEETRAALQHLGELYPTAGQAERAVEIVRGMLAQATTPEDRARYRFYAGFLRNQQGRHEDAVTELRAALAEAQTGVIGPAARFYLGTSLLELGRRDEALDAFGEILALRPEDRPPVPAGLLLRIEPMFFARNQPEKSEAICRWLMAGDDLEVVQQAVLRLAGLMAAQHRFDAADAELAGLRRRRQEAAAAAGAAAMVALPPDEEITSVQSELFLLRDQVPQAVVAAEQCLACRELGEDSATRARWVLAEALARQGHPGQALPYATKAYILGDHPIYSSRAMVLALRLLVGLNRMDEAKTTWAELRKRYPVVAEGVAGTAEAKAVLALDPVPAAGAP
jgi:tetratricopeptide (TPR) repeat protein